MARAEEPYRRLLLLRHNISGYSKNTRQKFSYPNVDSLICPVLYSPEILVHIFTEQFVLEDKNHNCETDECNGDGSDSVFVDASTKIREYFKQAELIV